jgi:hypothetical protein
VRDKHALRGEESDISCRPARAARNTAGRTSLCRLVHAVLARNRPSRLPRGARNMKPVPRSLEFARDLVCFVLAGSVVEASPPPNPHGLRAQARRVRKLDLPANPDRSTRPAEFGTPDAGSTRTRNSTSSASAGVTNVHDAGCDARDDGDRGCGGGAIRSSRVCSAGERLNTTAIPGSGGRSSPPEDAQVAAVAKCRQEKIRWSDAQVRCVF